MTTHAPVDPSPATIDRLHPVTAHRFSRVFRSTPSAVLGMLCALALLSVAPRAALADVFSDVAEATADGYQLVYTLPIPNTGNFRDATPVPYSVDNSATTGYFDRIAYYLELDGEYAYASMDAFSGNPANIGLPHNVTNPVLRQQIVSNMNVFHSGAGSGVTTPSGSTGLATGNIEMWPSNYGGGNSIGIPGASVTAFDFGDGGGNTGAGYGSFQVHNHGAGETLFAYNRWGTTGTSDLGIGNATSGEPDYTLGTGEASSYTTKNLQILVRPAGPPTAAAAGITANAPEASTFSVVYELPVQNGAFNAVTQYTVDASGAYVDGSFDRVAYYLELDHPTYGQQYAYVSMDPFTADASQTGVPSTDFFQQLVNNMNVDSNVAGVANGTGITTGNIEFWPSNYNGGNDIAIPNADGGQFDFGDGGAGLGVGYGSMQIHNHDLGAQQTIIAYNSWNSGTADLGIGNNPGGGRPDWTFANSSGNGANLYTVKNLWVLAQVDGAILAEAPLSGFTFELGEVVGMAQTTFDDLITLSNTGATNSIIDVSGFSLSGPDALLFDMPDLSQTLLQGGFLDTASFDVFFAGSTVQGDYSAVLTINTSEGPLTYNLSATVIPEPSTFALLLLGFGALAHSCSRRRNRRSLGG